MPHTDDPPGRCHAVAPGPRSPEIPCKTPPSATITPTLGQEKGAGGAQAFDPIRPGLRMLWAKAQGSAMIGARQSLKADAGSVARDGYGDVSALLRGRSLRGAAASSDSVSVGS